MADWSRAEVEAIVDDYFAMLEAERSGTPFNKAEHRRALERELNRRSKGSIERKHMNISAVLLKLDVPPIKGYLPLGNYQRLLGEVVEQRVSDKRVVDILTADIRRDVVVPSFDDILSAHVSPPAPRPGLKSTYPRRASEGRSPRKDVDYLAMEYGNRLLGEKGELFIERYEQARLSASRLDHLAKKVERVSKTRGDGLGYDILSYEESGKERLIEVKTTRYGQYWPFLVTPNEVAVSQEKSDNYQLYRLYSFEDSPKFFSVSGRIDREPFELSAALLRARVVGRE